MQIKRNLKHIFAIWAITIIALFGVVGLSNSSWLLDNVHRIVYRETGFPSLLYKYNFKPSTHDIAIIKIDDASINELQAKGNLKMLTIPKSIYIDLTEKLESVGVKGIAFDIIFQNKDPDEERFSEVLKNSKNSVIASTIDVCTPYNTPIKVLEELKRVQSDFEVMAYCDNIDYFGSILEQKYKENDLIKFHPAKCVMDEDGKYNTCEGIPRSVYEKVSWGLASMEGSGDRKIPYYTILSGSALSVDKFIPTLGTAVYSGSFSFPHKEAILQPFFGPPETYSSLSLSEVLAASKIDLIKNLAGKYIFIGESSSLIQDKHISPVTGTLMDGVEFHAHMLDGLLQKRFLVEWNIGVSGYFTIFILFIVFIFSSLYLFLPKYISPVFMIISLILTILVSRYIYFHYAVVVDINSLLISPLFSFICTFIYRFFIIDREKRQITQAFAHYVDPTLVGQIAEQSSEINLGGETRNLSILFSDIAGFTTLSEKLAPMDLFSLMSSYLSRMTDILTTHGGTLDKYIGDAVMGFFGAPLTLADHAKRACATALAMRAALPGFNTDITSRGIDPIDFRIGIASGEVMVGNIGSYDRFNYTVLGDTVNLASRLEATSKEYGTRIIVAEETYQAACDEYFFRKLDVVAVKGKTQGVGIYELIAKNSDTIDRTQYTRYSEALALYEQAKYLEAGKLFESNMIDDTPSRIMAMRCHDILEGKVVVEGGVYHMTHK